MPFVSKEGENNYAMVPREVEDVSAPPTEVGFLDNASIFSDSVDLDAEKKRVADDIQEDQHDQPYEQQEALSRGVHSNADTASVRNGSVEVSTEQQPKAAIKPRHTPLSAPVQWEPISLAVPEDDPNDEFDIGTAKKPVFGPSTGTKEKYVFVNGEPDLKGEVVSCFEEPGLLYRVVDKSNKIWAFYNDSLSFEVHVSCTFGKHSKIEALENTTIHRDENGNFIAEVVVYPAETEFFVKGFVNGFSSRMRALPISDEYLSECQQLQFTNVVEVDMNYVKALVGDNTDATKALEECVKHNVPFVDMEFPPIQLSIEAGAKRPLKLLPWFRPQMYLNPALVDQIRLFRKEIVPGDVRQGELGDCWFMCAITTLEEHPEMVQRMFRHPQGAEVAREERAVGAYRVTLNKNGLWNSVIVDNYLPALGGKPKFASSTDLCEMWPSILEKAYAKLHGSYGMIQSGDPVHALTDMTGCSSSRFDDAFNKAKEDGGKEFFRDLLQLHNSGYQLLLTTPGKAPAFLLGTDTHANAFSNEPELEKLLGGTGLIPGHAYTVEEIYHFPDEGDVRLMKIRNVWGSCKEWNGPWSTGSSEWESHPNVAVSCNYENTDDTSVWMDWEHVLQFFIGGGVHFLNEAYDYRVPIIFADCRPSLVMEVSVDSPVRVCVSLSNVDHRGLYTENQDDESREYPPLMISISSTHPDQEGVHKVIQNSSVDPANPSPDKWTFMQGRDVSMFYELTPEQSPYLIIPRMMETEETTHGSKAWFTSLQGKIHPLHFVNSHPSEGNVAEVPVVLGLRCEQPVGDGGVRVDFRRLEDDNVVFENFPKFPADTVAVEEAYYQVRTPTPGFAVEKVGPSLF
ncbi:calpain-like cysteine peptidase [Trypanosoma theileri]|uniref:Calpain-like cysteine peptidase n=1 Tax=Trypanosoma theileri TaxID=67003 RepID=A0A1X0NMT3_9TRYP|nr:calpain-like cysteine peptidase [Trypanosoma theileri]ORC85440.1 calpain-like cysteine peptidase [Trypanosoma theileri]